MGNASLTLKSSNGKDEVLLFADRMILKLYTSYTSTSEMLSHVFVFMLYLYCFFMFILNSGLFVIVFYVTVGFLIFREVNATYYVFDFHNRVISRNYFGVITWPVLKFDNIQSVAKVWLIDFGESRHFFYRIWKKGKKFGVGIPLSGVHDLSDGFDEKFSKFILPKIYEAINVEEIHDDGKPLIKKKFPLVCQFYMENGNVFFKHGIKRLAYSALLCGILFLY